ncbi:uncharacterized protein LOC136071684 [Hydra vulgaris]|uniref:uncharacterized protein LOC136071684 n=1 Tax=Hydra vulgaris TaxID=6087 RepID=UPI0032EA45C5
MKILTQKLESIELNVIDALLLLNSTISILKETSSDDTSMNNLVESSIQFACKLGIDPTYEFNRAHRRRLLPKKLDSNSNSQATVDMKTFYRAEFKKVLDKLITLSMEHLTKCMSTIEPIFNLFSTPLKSNIHPEYLKKVIAQFPPGSSASKLTDYDEVFSEFSILVHHCLDISNLKEILKTSESLKHLLPNVIMMLRLVYTAPVSTASNERSFSKLKIIKNYLRSTSSSSRLQNLMLLNYNKDILDKIDLKLLTDKWSILKERRIIV